MSIRLTHLRSSSPDCLCELDMAWPNGLALLNRVGQSQAAEREHCIAFQHAQLDSGSFPRVECHPPVLMAILTCVCKFSRALQAAAQSELRIYGNG